MTSSEFVVELLGVMKAFKEHAERKRFCGLTHKKQKQIGKKEAMREQTPTPTAVKIARQLHSEGWRTYDHDCTENISRSVEGEHFYAYASPEVFEAMHEIEKQGNP